MRRTLVIKLLVALTVGGAVFAMAATLSVTSDSLGAGNATVSSCDTAVGATYTSAWDATVNAYEVTAVNITGLDGVACQGKTLKVTLLNSGTELVEETATVLSTDTGKTLTLATQPLASAVNDIHVFIG